MVATSADEQTIVLGSRVLGFFEGTSGWAGEMANGDDFDRLIHDVFQTIKHTRPGKDGAVRMKLTTEEVEAVLYYADVMLDASNPANTGDPDRTEFTAAQRLISQIRKKWPNATL